MIDIKLLRENPELVKENIKKKFQTDKLPLVDKVLKIDGEWRKLKNEEDKLRSSRNSISKEISEAKKQKKDVSKLLKQAKDIPDEIAKLEEKRKKFESQILEIMKVIPNIIDKSVPIGKDDSENIELKKFGKPEVPAYTILHHAELAEKNEWADFDSARETSGNGFYYLTGDLALLHSAMLAFARDYMVKQGFVYTIPPFMIRRKVVEGVMSFKEMDAMMYKIDGEDLYLIGTSEHSMIGRFIDKTISGKRLPLLLTSYSPCFRKEIRPCRARQSGQAPCPSRTLPGGWSAGQAPDRARRWRPGALARSPQGCLPASGFRAASRLAGHRRRDGCGGRRHATCTRSRRSPSGSRGGPPGAPDRHRRTCRRPFLAGLRVCAGHR
jgi:hypothetical protein